MHGLLHMEGRHSCVVRDAAHAASARGTLCLVTTLGARPLAADTGRRQATGMLTLGRMAGNVVPGCGASALFSPVKVVDPFEEMMERMSGLAGQGAQEAPSFLTDEWDMLPSAPLLGGLGLSSARCSAHETMGPALPQLPGPAARAMWPAAAAMAAAGPAQALPAPGWLAEKRPGAVCAEAGHACR